MGECLSIKILVVRIYFLLSWLQSRNILFWLIGLKRCQFSHLSLCSTHILYVSCVYCLQLSIHILNTYSHWTRGGVSWAAAMVWLHRIRTRSVEKGCGLKPATSVAVASPLPVFCRGRRGGGAYAEDTLLSASCLFAKSQKAARC